MFKLKRIQARNFLSFKSVDLNGLEVPGLWLICGYNEKGGDSNGAGKSAILSIISMALWGRTSKGVMADVGNWDNPSWSVELEMCDNGNLYVIQRSAQATMVSVNGELIKGHKRDIQAVIEQLFNSNFQIFTNSTLWSQGKTEFIAASTDEEKKKLLKSVLQLEALDAGYENARKVHDQLEKEANDLNVQIKMIEARCQNRLKTIEDLESKRDAWEVSIANRIKSLEKDIASKPNVVLENTNKLKELQEVYSNGQKSYEAAIARMDELDSSIRLCYDTMAIIQSQIADRGERLNKLLNLTAGSVCSQCGSVLTADSIDSCQLQLKDELKKLNSKMKKVTSSVRAYESEALELKQIIVHHEQLEEQIRRLEQASEYELRLQKEHDKHIARMKKDLEALRHEVNPYVELINKEHKQAKKDQEDLHQANEKLKVVTHRIDIYAFLKWLLSKEGAPSYLIEQSFARLEQLANVYMSRLCMEGYRIEIKPQRELKSRSGALKEEIDIAVLADNKRIPYWNMSDGQRQRLNIALLIALHKLCKDKGVCPFDFLLLDEILDLSLDSRGQEDVVACLRTLLQEVSSIYLISHKEHIVDLFDHKIYVVRDRNGVSQIVSCS
jgi:DNA repair exonuclease SbcCD ATPase subunit